jgi:hypothetical protein
MRLILTLFLATWATSPLSADGQQVPTDRPAKIWNRTGPLDKVPEHITDKFPLSDQENEGGWVKFNPMSDEFEGDGLDLERWNLGLAPWRGRQPGLFSDKNVTLGCQRMRICHPRSASSMCELGRSSRSRL